MTAQSFTLTNLDHFKTGGFPIGYPPSQRMFFAPVDDLKGCLRALLTSAQRSLQVGMYGFDDPDLAEVIRDKLLCPSVFVQLSLDASQARGVHERDLLDQDNYPASSIAIGTSERGAIMHLKMVVVDGLFTVTGSTNWSRSAETEQDNQLSVCQDAAVAADAATRLNVIHANMLAHMRRAGSN